MARPKEQPQAENRARRKIEVNGEKEPYLFSVQSSIARDIVLATLLNLEKESSDQELTITSIQSIISRLQLFQNLPAEISGISLKIGGREYVFYRGSQHPEDDTSIFTLDEVIQLHNELGKYVK